MKYSVCASSVFSGTPLSRAIMDIHSLGYSAYEFWEWEGQDLDAVLSAQEKTGLYPVCMCTRLLPLNRPERLDDYINGLRDSICAAKKLGCSMLITQVGQEIPDVDRAVQHAAIVTGLRKCAPILEENGITLAVEPLNTLVDHKGYYLSSSGEAFDIIKEVNSPNVKVLYDVYHQQITEGYLIRTITKNIEYICHIHIAGVPGRHEPTENCEICYPAVLSALKASGYDGFVGLEYFPTASPEIGLENILQKMPL